MRIILPFLSLILIGHDISAGTSLEREMLITGSELPTAEVQSDEGDLSWILEWNRNFSSGRERLGMDEAWFAVRSKVNTNFSLMYENQQCDGCPLRSIGKVAGEEVFTLKINSKFGSRFAISTSGLPEDVTCKLDIWLRQHGDYWMVVDGDSGDLKCRLLLINDPPNMYLPVLYLFIILMGLIVIWIVISTLVKKGYMDRLICWKTSVDLPTANNIDSMEMANGHTSGQNGHVVNGHVGKNEALPPARKRLVSLDTFRGFSLVIMIFVNYGGGGYYFFAHVPWNGLAVADLVFPWFVFMMGTSIAFSFRGMAKRQNPKGQIFLRVLKRTCLLFLIGISLNSSWYPFLNKLRIPGVLQRLALSYLLTAVPQIFFATASNDNTGRLGIVSDIVQYWPEWIVHAGYLAVYLGLTFGLPVPGCPKGYLGPGGMHDGGAYFNCSGGAAGYIDRMVLTNSHIYQYPTSKTMFRGVQAFDPEGILGTFSSAFTCFLGLQAGKILLHHKSHRGRLTRWSIWALTTAALGILLCKGSVNDGWIPINKNLWSLSFALVIAATGYTCLVLFYALTDLSQVWSGAPFLYPGMNSLVIYFCHESFGKYFPIRWRVEEVHWQVLAMSAWATGAWVIVAYILYRKKIFVAL